MVDWLVSYFTLSTVYLWFIWDCAAAPVGMGPNLGAVDIS